MMFASIFFLQTEVQPFEYVQEAFKRLLKAGFCFAIKNSADVRHWNFLPKYCMKKLLILIT